MMLEVDLRPIRKDGLEGGLGVGYGDGLGYAAIFVLVDDSRPDPTSKMKKSVRIICGDLVYHSLDTQ